MNYRTMMYIAGAWLQNKAWKQQRESGTLQAAKNLRKQGVPLPIALNLLVYWRTAQ